MMASSPDNRHAAIADAYDFSRASLVADNLGGALGGILLGQASDRSGAPLPVLVCAYLVAGMAILSIGLIGTHGGLLMAAIFVAGFCTLGGQTALNAAAAGFYPTQVRATGVGYALGVGRLGSIVGPLLAGVVIAANWSPAALFAARAAPSLAAAAALTALVLARRKEEARPRTRQPRRPPSLADRPRQRPLTSTASILRPSASALRAPARMPGSA
jgi:AAHS family 4-hydroxybenzoate transporter-like MFS transporter